MAKKQKSLIWSTKSISACLKSIHDTGIIPMDNPFFEKKLTKLKGDINFKYEEEEILEMAKWREDALYFAQSAAQILTDKGAEIIKLHPYQKKVLLQFTKYKKHIYLASRQIGKSWVTAIFIVWYLLNHKDKTIVLASATEDKVTELMEKIDLIIAGLPWYAKPGYKHDNILRKVFDNGCKVIGQTTTENTGAGYAVDLLYLDEFALVHKNIKNKLYRTVIPTLSTRPDAWLIITSTARGRDKFYDIYNGALNGKNNFNPIRTDWYEYPGRDERWKAEQIADLGSEEDFNQEYGCQFFAGNQLLFRPELLKKIKKHSTKFVHRDLPILDDEAIEYHDKLKFHPAFDTNDLTSGDAKFMASIDLGSGVGADYTVMNLKQIVPMTLEEIDQLKVYSKVSDFFKMRQVAVYRDNLTEIPEFARFMYHFLTGCMDQECIKMVVEMNHKGEYFEEKITNLYSVNNELEADFVFCQFPYNMVWQDAKTFKTGITQQEKIKDKGCKLLVDRVKYNQLVFFEGRTIEEALSFSRNKKGEYKSELDNDDVILTEVNGTHFYDTQDYEEFCESLLENCPIEFINLVESKLEKQDMGERRTDREAGLDDDLNMFQ